MGEELLVKLKEPEGAAAIAEYVDDPLDPDEDAETQSTVFIIMLKQTPFHLAVISRVPGIRDFSPNFLTTAPHMELTQVEKDTSAVAGVIGEFDYYLQGTAIASRKTVGPA